MERVKKSRERRFFSASRQIIVHGCEMMLAARGGVRLTPDIMQEHTYNYLQTHVLSLLSLDLVLYSSFFLSVKQSVRGFPLNEFSTSNELIPECS